MWNFSTISYYKRLYKDRFYYRNCVSAILDLDERRQEIIWSFDSFCNLFDSLDLWIIKGGKMKKLFTIKDSWPWALILLFVSIVTFFAIRAYDGTKDSLLKLILLGVVDLTFMAIIEYRYHLRYQFVYAWNSAYHTVTNVAILADQAGVKLIQNNLYDRSTWQAINDEINKCAKFWSDWYDQEQQVCYIVKNLDLINFKIIKALDGATLSIVDAPFMVTFVGKVMGVQEGQNICVVYDGDRIKTLDQLLALCRHEVSHLCLSALGVDNGYAGTTHHEIFAKTNFC